MINRVISVLKWSVAERGGDRIVPPAGLTSHLTFFTSAAMALLALFALTFAFSADRVADRWSSELVRTGTIRLSAPEGQVEVQTRAVITALETTPGIAAARVIPREEQGDLLTPWLGADLPLDSLPLPRLIEVVETAEGPDADGLRLRLAAEAPGAVWDDHVRWRAPIVRAAQGMRWVAIGAVLLIMASVAAIVTLAAHAALNANTDVIRTLRLIGAEDRFIARAFVRRSTFRALFGGAVGALVAALVLFVLPQSEDAEAVLSGFGLKGAEWALVLVIPLLIGIVAFAASRFAAHKILHRFG